MVSGHGDDVPYFRNAVMSELIAPTFDSFAFAALGCLALRLALVAVLPDHIAGPGGWLIDTTPDGRCQ